jgi:hypothetical protein
VPLLCFATYLALALHTLRVSHPMEDAYILFHYVENFVAGHGIAFNAGGPRAEGATDFLWFLMLSGLVKCGLNVAVAAGLLNALGAGLASFVCVAAVRLSACRGPCTFVLALLSLPVVLVGGGLAGLFGFSAMLYSALALFVLSVAHGLFPRALSWIPILALVLGLFRPDGVILGVAYTLIGVDLARRAQRLRPYCVNAALALGSGALYFAWRFHYFGLPLPLPLYVKEHTLPSVDLATALAHPRTHFLGFESNMIWLESTLGPLRLAVCALLLALLARSPWSSVRRLLVLLVPSAVLFVALSLVRQTQNVAFRFQAPLELAAFYATFWLCVQACANARTWIVRVVGCALFVACAWTIVVPSIARMNAAWKLHTYMDTFPALLAHELQPGRVVALTDAGRIPYWTDARVEDIVGLNTPSAALSPPTLADVEALAPDLVMFNTANVFEFPDRVVKDRPFIPVTREKLRAALVPECRAAFDGGPLPTGLHSIRENLAALALGRYLDAHPDFDVFAVAYGAGYGHVWGFRRDMAELPGILRALERATSGADKRSYLDLAEERTARATPR